MPSEEFIKANKALYKEMLKEHGIGSAGVGMGTEERRQLRFDQLLELVDSNRDSPFSLLDYGCGNGGLSTRGRFLFPSLIYTGFDINNDALAVAKEQLKSDPNQVSWVNQLSDNETFDYVLSSGLFGVSVIYPMDIWNEKVKETLHEFDKYSKKGFAFNSLTIHSDKEHMKDWQYYADPAELLAYCRKHFSDNVQLLDDYGLFEFTILVRK